MTSGMDYSRADRWLVGQRGFDPEALGKCEAIFCQGNGYLGLRNATDEAYPGEQRNLFVAGTFNRFDANEVTELPNAADLTRLDLRLDGESFSLLRGSARNCDRTLCLRDGETVRRLVWQSPAGREYAFEFRRFVSLGRLHVLGQKVSITPLDADAALRLYGGIDGRMTNGGSQHFSEGDKRLYDGRFLQYVQTTEQSHIDFVLNTTFSFALGGAPLEARGFVIMERRTIGQGFELSVPKGKTLCIEKLSSVYTSRDRGGEGRTLGELKALALAGEKEAQKLGYDALRDESARCWQQRVWSQVPVEIEADDPFDQLAVRFAQYHFYVMAPAHDPRMSIGAKGLSGEAYKGHTFWDNEIFTLPYFIFSEPKTARSLEEYRGLSLPGAHKKAAENGYAGAQYPWEAAWIDDGEATPVWGAADIITGLPTKIWSGFIEQHITADVAWGVWQYYQATMDEAFMDEWGWEIVLDTGKFWASRLEEGDDGRLHINDVVGPDEYKEHVNDNAFTNYMAAWNMRLAAGCAARLKAEKPALYRRLDEKLGLAACERAWAEKLPRLYLPQLRADGVIAQDSTYLTLENIDLTKYKKQTRVGSICRDYSQQQITQIQVSKQADILVFFLLLEDEFPADVKRANWNYYEPRTLHDSSLSLSTHCILANDLGDDRLAYELFRRAAAIDLGPDEKSSDAGIHTASLGGIWQSAVLGFGGVRLLNGGLRIDPALPAGWRRLAFTLYWRGQKLRVTVTHGELTVENETGTAPAEFTVYGVPCQVANRLVVPLPARA